MKKREPNFENVLKILRHEKPNRPTLFEFAIDGGYQKRNADPSIREDWTWVPTGVIKKGTPTHRFAKTGPGYLPIHF